MIWRWHFRALALKIDELKHHLHGEMSRRDTENTEKCEHNYRIEFTDYADCRRVWEQQLSFIECA